MSKQTPKKKDAKDNENQQESAPAGPVRTVLRWPLYLPSGDVKELQVLDILPGSPFYEYRSIPGAGKFYGGQVLTTRVKYINVLIKKYLSDISNCMKAGQPIEWPEGILANDESGLSILQSEYFMVNPSLAIANASSKKKHVKLNASQLIFGFEKRDHDWLIEEVDFAKGNFDGLKEDRRHYCVWLSSEESGEYRQYRIEERWVWNSYKTDYQTSYEEAEGCNKFFKYAFEKSEEHSEDWKKVQESLFPEVKSLFAIFAVNPKRGMTLFENLNFKNKKKWHCYKPLSKHVGIDLKKTNNKFMTTFTDDAEINWKHSIDLVTQELSKMDGVEKNALCESAEASYRKVVERQMAMQTLESYKKLTDYCKNNNLDMEDVEKLETLEVYAEFKKNVRSLLPLEQGTRHLRVESIDDAYALLDNITIFARFLRTNRERPSDKLRKCFEQVQSMRSRLVLGANAYEYRRRALVNTKNQNALAMQAKFVLACFNYKKQLSPFEEEMLWAISFPRSNDSESVTNFSRCMREVGEPDKSLPKREVLGQLNKNFRELPAIFEDIRSETLEMGYKQFEHYKVTFNDK